MTFLYPRLSRAHIDVEVDRLELALASDSPILPFPDGGHHPSAVFPAEGTPVSPARLRELRESVTTSLSTFGPRPRVGRERHFDAVVGEALAKWFEDEGRDQASHPDIWPYLTLVVLPDLAVQRFGPDARGRLARERFGLGRRNVFHRLYLRSWILGSLLSDPQLPLFEDELVGLVDRSLSSDHRLARFVAEQIQGLERSQGRREVVRRAFKALQFELRVTDATALDDDALRSMLSEIFHPAKNSRTPD